MPALRSTLLLPDDSERLDRLSAVLTALTTDSDADVAAAARAVAGEYQSRLLRRKGEVPPEEALAFEAADDKKLAEEGDLVMSADEIERMKAENGLDKRRQAAAALEAAASQRKPAAKAATADSKAGAKPAVRKPEATLTPGPSQMRSPSPSASANPDASRASASGSSASPASAAASPAAAAAAANRVRMPIAPPLATNSISPSSGGATGEDMHWSLKAQQAPIVRSSSDATRLTLRLARLNVEAEQQLGRANNGNLSSVDGPRLQAPATTSTAIRAVPTTSAAATTSSKPAVLPTSTAKPPVTDIRKNVVAKSLPGPVAKAPALAPAAPAAAAVIKPSTTSAPKKR